MDSGIYEKETKEWKKTYFLPLLHKCLLSLSQTHNGRHLFLFSFNSRLFPFFPGFQLNENKRNLVKSNVNFAEITLNFYELRLSIILCALFDINLDLWPKAWFQNDLKKVFQSRLIFLLFVLQRDPFPPTWWLPSTHNQIWRFLRPWKCQNFRHPVSKFSFHHNSKCVSCSFYWRL